MSPSFLFPAFPGLTEVLLSAPPSAIPDFLPRTTNRPIPGVRAESSLPGRPPASRSRQVLQAARPGPQIAPRPSLARPAPSLASPPPGAWAQAQGPRDLRSRGPTARCCASHPGRGFGPGPLTHPTIARPKSWCFLRAAAPTSPSTHRRKGPATRSPEAPPRPTLKPKSLFQRGADKTKWPPPGHLPSMPCARGDTPRPGRRRRRNSAGEGAGPPGQAEGKPGPGADSAPPRLCSPSPSLANGLRCRPHSLREKAS